MWAHVVQHVCMIWSNVHAQAAAAYSEEHAGCIATNKHKRPWLLNVQHEHITCSSQEHAADVAMHQNS